MLTCYYSSHFPYATKDEEGLILGVSLSSESHSHDPSYDLSLGLVTARTQSTNVEQLRNLMCLQLPNHSLPTGFVFLTKQGLVQETAYSHIIQWSAGNSKSCNIIQTRIRWHVDGTDIQFSESWIAQSAPHFFNSRAFCVGGLYFIAVADYQYFNM